MMIICLANYALLLVRAGIGKGRANGIINTTGLRHSTLKGTIAF
jgi:hypothetical protein